MSHERSIKRAQQKLAYEKFSKAWRKEKSYQASVLAKGETLPEGTPPLRRKPTFKQWIEITRTYQAQQTVQPVEVQEFVNDVDLSWDEEEGTKSPGAAGIDQTTEVQD